MADDAAQVVGTVTEEDSQGDSPDRAVVVRRAYSRATTDLRQKHAAEFHALVQEYAAEDGVDWSPRPTAEDRAREQMEKIRAEFPNLR